MNEGFCRSNGVRRNSLSSGWPCLPFLQAHQAIDRSMSGPTSPGFCDDPKMPGNGDSALSLQLTVHGALYFHVDAFYKLKVRRLGTTIVHADTQEVLRPILFAPWRSNNMLGNVCFACGDGIDRSEFERARRLGTMPDDSTIKARGDLCFSCFGELVLCSLPLVTNSSLKPAGTSQVSRQQHGRRHTDG